MNKFVEVVQAGGCLVCFVRNHPAPLDPVGLAFLAGFLQGQKSTQDRNHITANFCPSHASLHHQMATTSFLGITG